MFSEYKSKRANSVIDTVLVLVVLFIFSLGSVIGYKIFTDLNDDVQASDDLSASTKAKSQSLYDRFPSVFDGGFLIVFILLWGLILVASYQINAYPIFFVFTLVLLIAVFVVGAEFTNFYEEFTADSDISDAANEFPITNYIMGHLLQFGIGIGFTVVIVLFGKIRAGGM